jgi:DNA-binding NarL/FixJ family response regulator
VKPITTVIVDDEIPACMRLKKLLSECSGLQVLECLSHSGKAIDFMLAHKPDLVFLDIEMENNISAFDIIKQLHDKLYWPTIILVTAHPHYSIKAIKHQVFDYLLKPVDVDDLKETVNRYLDHLQKKANDLVMQFKMLSQREAEVLRLVLQGKSSQEIAGLLFISVNTVNTHRRNILKKTGASSIFDLVRINQGEHV